MSIKTVSRVVNGSDNVAAQTRRRVLAAVAELDYVRNAAAHSLRTGSSKAIGIIVDSLADPFFATLVSVVESRALADGISVLVAATGRSAERERDQVSRLISQNISALLLAPTESDHSYLLDAAKGIPVVLIDRGWPDSPYDTVRVHDRGGARTATEHLIRHGHRRIAFIGDAPALPTITHREGGYLDALNANKIDPDERLIRSDCGETDSAETAVAKLLALPEPPTAIFASNQRAGLGVVKALHSAGRTDVALVVFGDFSLADLSDPCCDRHRPGPGAGGIGGRRPPAGPPRRKVTGSGRDRPAADLDREGFRRGAAVFPILMPPNLIDHFYRGGAKIAALRGVGPPATRQPEEWLAATVARSGEPGAGPGPHRRRCLLRDLVAADPPGLARRPPAGAPGRHRDAGQAARRRPAAAGARASRPARSPPGHLHCPYGKTEAWYVLDADRRRSAVYLGWTDDVDPDELAGAATRRTATGCWSTCNRIEVRPGDGIAGARPAPRTRIGAGVFVAEVQEPTDFSIVLEWSVTTATRDDSHLGLGFDVAWARSTTAALDGRCVGDMLRHTPVLERAESRLRCCPATPTRSSGWM